MRTVARSLVVLVLLAACGESVITPPPEQPPPGRQEPAAIQVLSGTQVAGVAGIRAPDSVLVKVVDASGRGVPGVQVQFTTSEGAGSFSSPVASTDSAGRASSWWILGTRVNDHHATIRVAGVPLVLLTANATPLSPALTAMLRGLDAQIAWSRADLQDAAPRNPQLAAWFNARLAMLGNAALPNDIVRARRWVEDSVRSSNGRILPVNAVFPMDSMRAESRAAVEELKMALSILESFMGLPFPTAQVQVWNGFKVGSAGGGGSLFLEDRATYESRTPASRLPWSSVLGHEVAHSWIGHESLTQFLELYAYNQVRGGTAELATWGFTRGWTPGREDNTGVHALLDVYLAIGAESMSQAYRQAYILRPQYGQPLAAMVQQKFVDVAPPAQRELVAAKMARVGF